MGALVCAATRFMGGNGHFISGRRQFSGQEVSSGGVVVCNAINALLSSDDRSSGKVPANVHGFARRSARREVADR